MVFNNFKFNMTTKNTILFALIAVGLLAMSTVWANWTPPPGTPPDCPDTNPACHVPINVSSLGQIKSGSFNISFGNFVVGPMNVPVFSVLSSEGKVGIGTGSPTAQLDVVGLTRFRSNVGIGDVITPRTALEIGGDNSGILATGTLASGWDGGSLGSGSRLMWIPSKAAFRAGRVLDNRWDSNNIGNYSVAMGYRTQASGAQSTAFGIASTASGDSSTAFGDTTASGILAMSLGAKVVVQGTRSVGVGLDDTSRTITQPNTMAIVGGNVGIGAVSPTTQLHTTGGVRLAGVAENTTNTNIITSDNNGNLAWRSPGAWTGSSTGNGDIKQWKYVGATPQSYNGQQVGGYDGGDAKCGVQYSGSRMLSAADMANGRPNRAGWYNTFTYSVDTDFSGTVATYMLDCQGWTSVRSGDNGARWDSASGFPSRSDCSSPRPILCASLQ